MSREVIKKVALGLAETTLVLALGSNPDTVQKETPHVLVKLKETDGQLTYESLQAGFHGPLYKRWEQFLETPSSIKQPLLVGLRHGTQRAFTLVKYPDNVIMLMRGRDQACVLADERRMELFERLTREAQEGKQVSSWLIFSIMNGASHCKSVWDK